MARTLAQQLDDVDAAIERAEAAQSSTAADGRSRTNPLLETLYRRRDAIERRIRRAADGSVMVGEV
jgi:hypothetical protein